MVAVRFMGVPGIAFSGTANPIGVFLVVARRLPPAGAFTLFFVAFRVVRNSFLLLKQLAHHARAVYDYDDSFS